MTKNNIIIFCNYNFSFNNTRNSCNFCEFLDIKGNLPPIPICFH